MKMQENKVPKSNSFSDWVMVLGLISLMIGAQLAVAAEYEPLRADNNKFIYCSGSKAKAGDKKDLWKISSRKLLNKNGQYLDCSEKLRDGDDCSCNGSGERFHGGPDVTGGTVRDSIGDGKSGKIFPNNGKEYCLSVNGDTLEVRASANGKWQNCDTFKLTGATDGGGGSGGGTGGGSDGGGSNGSSGGGVSDLQISTGKNYAIAENLSNGVAAYIDRDYTYSNVPSYLLGATYIKPANNDKSVSGSAHIRFTLDEASSVYVAYDARAGKPSWLSNYVDTGNSLKTDQTLNLYKREFSAGPVSLNGNNNDSVSHYVVIVVPGDAGNGGGSGSGSGGGSSNEGVKIAFIGDTGAGSNFQSVLDLIKSEGAELTVVAGDTSYDKSKDDDWDRMVRNTLGPNDPSIVVAGNHDYGDSNFGNVVNYGKNRLNKASEVTCSGAYGEKMTCRYKNVYFVLSAIGSSGSRSNHESFIKSSLNSAPEGAWRVCAWHKNQREMQVGGKNSEVGWGAYETCRENGAIIATGHEHSYSRTHLLSDMSSQTIASKSSSFTVEEGKTFAFVSGLGGIGIRDQEIGGSHWGKIYTSTQGARYGAMFGTFYDDRAEFYFKNIRGQIVDQFTVIKGYDNNGSGGGTGGGSGGGEETSYATITSPQQGAVFEQGQDIRVSVNAEDNDGIDSVRLWVDDTYHDVDGEAPYQLTAKDLPVGEHRLWVRMRDVNDNPVDSEPVTIIVKETNGGGSGGSSGEDIGGEGWVKCADEDQMCDFSGTKVVAYGANGVFVTKSLSDGVRCANTVFGDPISGVRKACYYELDDGGTGGGSGGGTGGNGEATPRGLYTYSFGGLESMSVQNAVGLLNGLGYAGIAVEARGADSLSRLAQYQNWSQQLGDDFSVMSAFMAHKFGDYGFDDSDHRKAIDRLSGKEGQLWVWFRDNKNNVTSAQLENFIRKILDYATSKGVEVVLYPHVNNMMPTAVSAFNMAEKINHPNLGIAFNLTHELNAREGNDVAENFAKVKDRVRAVTISGSRNGNHILPLDNSAFDLKEYMLSIKASDFEGPVGFLNHKLENPSDYLERSIDAWNTMSLEVGLLHPDSGSSVSDMTLNLEDDNLTVGDRVSIRFAGSLHDLDWVAIYALGDNDLASCEQNKRHAVWQYASGESGVLHFDGLSAGTYQAQPLSNDGYCHAGDVLTFDIAEEGGNGGESFESLTEAENVAASNDVRISTYDPGFTGAGYIDFGGDGSWIEWRSIEVPVDGKYQLTFRYTNGKAPDRRTRISVNGVNQGHLAFSSTGSWSTWKTETVAIPLKQGLNIIRLTADSGQGVGGPNLDSMLVTLLDSGSGGGNGGGTGGGSGADNAIHLPIEVLGPQGFKRTVTFELNDPSNITHLYLRCNSCGFDDKALDGNANLVKATVRVNNGSAINLKHYRAGGSAIGNRNIEIIGPEKQWGGIGGAFRTVRMKVPVSGLKKGTNTLTFEHKTLHAPSIGYRIVELNLLENGSMNRKVLGNQDFVDDNPRDWEPPRKSATDIARGRELWRKENVLNDPGLDKIDGSGNGDMVASCAGCHATDGRDLKYFNFSNHSIVERSKFHGLSQTEGELIASYIRSIDIPVVDQARPWNPAYQPGPGLDDQPVYEWAAGAGLDAVLDDDADMAPYLFPKGTSQTAVREVVDRYDTLNFRELPVAIPMPDWNQWLAPIHPDDAFRASRSAVTSDHKGRNVGKPYWEKLYEDARRNPNAETLAALTEKINLWQAKGADCFANGKSKGWRTRAFNGDVLEALKIPVPTLNDCNRRKNRSVIEGVETVKKGLAGWGSVKMWSIIHSNDLEEASQKVGRSVCSGGRCIDASEKRGWVVNFRTLFDRAAHFIGHDSKFFVTQDDVTGTWENTAWYHLNLVLNPGYRSRNEMPSHFAYTIPWIERSEDESKLSQSYRYWATTIKMRQLQTNGQYGEEEGLDLRTAQPYRFYSNGSGGTALRDGVGKDLWSKLATALLEDFVDDAEHASAKDWAEANQNSKVQPRNSTIKGCGPRGDLFPNTSDQGDNTYCVIPLYRDIGVNESALNALIDWGKDTWPNGNWNRLKR